MKYLKHYLFIALENLRRCIGRAQCAIKGSCDADTDMYEFDPEVSRFYACCRCGRDAITGQSFKDWVDETAISKWVRDDLQ